jgi:hypothetical protein
MMRTAGIAGGFVVALALGPSADAQQISACVNNSDGTLRIVAPNTTCRSHETPLSWNAVGIQGPKGDTGATGATGAQGPAGQALASKSYICAPDTEIQSYSGDVFKPLTFNRSIGMQDGFGSSISDGLLQFTNFTLQPGLYQIHLSGARFVSDILIDCLPPLKGCFQKIPMPMITAYLNPPSGSPPFPFWVFVSESGYPTSPFGLPDYTGTTSLGWDLVGGDRLLQVNAANSTLQMVITSSGAAASIRLPNSGNCELVITQLK